MSERDVGYGARATAAAAATVAGRMGWRFVLGRTLVVCCAFCDGNAEDPCEFGFAVGIERKVDRFFESGGSP